MTFDLNKSIEILERTPAILEELFIGLSNDWIMNNEGENTWSPYEILGHLIHGEKTDWIPRAKIMLSDAEDKTFTPFDRFAQAEWGTDKPIEELLREFRTCREENLKILKGMNLDETKLKANGIHPELGSSVLKELLSTWTVHDLGHIAQITRVMSKQLKNEVGPWKQYLGILKQ